MNLITVIKKYGNRIYNYDSSFCGKRDYNGKLITAENLLSTNYTIIANSENTIFITIDKDEISKHPKYSWLERLSSEQLLKSNLWIAKLITSSLSLRQKYYDTQFKNPSGQNVISVNKFPSNKELLESVKDSNLYFENPYNLIHKQSYRNS